MLKFNSKLITYNLSVIFTILLFSGYMVSFAEADYTAKYNKALDLLIEKDYEPAKNIFNEQLLKLNIDNIPQGLSTLLQEPFFLEEEVLESVITSQEELDYLRKVVIYKKLADHITKGLKTDFEIIYALFDWTVRNISLFHDKDVGQDINAYPYDYMMRGFGGCDRSAWVLTTLAGQAGFRAHIIVLPYHTMTQIFIENKWVLFDPFYNNVFKSTKGLSGLNEPLEVQSFIKEKKCYKDNFFNDLMECRFEIICEPLSVLPKMKLLQNTFDKNLNSPPALYYDVLEEIEFLISSMITVKPKEDATISIPYNIPGKKQRISLALYPFSNRFGYRPGLISNNFELLFPNQKYITRAREFQLTGNYVEAMGEYNKLIASPPDASLIDTLVYYKALCYYEMQDLKEAKHLFESYKENYPDGDMINGVVYHLQMIERELLKGTTFSEPGENSTKPESDIVSYNLKDLIRINTNDSLYKEQDVLYNAYNFLAVYFKSINKVDKAISALKKTIEINPDIVNAHHNSGITYFENGKLDEAINAFKNSLKIDPDFFESHRCLGLVYTNNGDYNNAIIHLKRALEINRNQIDALNLLGFAYINTNKYDEAISTYSISLKLNPMQADSWYNLGWIYFKENNPDEAIIGFKNVLMLQPDNEKALSLLCTTYINKQDYAKAMPFCNKAMELGGKIPADALKQITSSEDN